MKSFFATKTSGKVRRMGTYTLTFSVYQITKNLPVYIGTVEASSGSYKGDESCVMNYIANTGLIPAKYKEGYYRDMAKKDFTLSIL